MISNQILQNTIEGLRGISGAEMCVTDVGGKIIASTSDKLEKNLGNLKGFVDSEAESQELQGRRYYKIFDEMQLEYILIVSGTDDNLYLIGKLAAFQLTNLLIAYKERFDKDNFIKNLLLDNLLLVDIYSRGKKLRIPTAAKRDVLIVETATKGNVNVLETLREYGTGVGAEFVTAVDETAVIIVLSLDDNGTIENVNQAAEGVEAFLKSKGISDVRIAFGTIVSDIKEVSKSYKEAKMALDVGKIFFDERSITPYSELGIGRLIYQLPLPLCKMFIREIFGDKNLDEFDDETIKTINKFFENNQNVSEASRQLNVHRNTLVYRLDMLQKRTGLDLRIFNDAITIKIALMVLKYMRYMENYEF